MEKSKKKTPWYESAPFWGCGSLGITIILTVLTVRNFRWLLIFAWPLLGISEWVLCQTLTSKTLHWISFLVLVVASGSGLWFLYGLLEPGKPTLFARCSPQNLPIKVIRGDPVYVLRLNSENPSMRESELENKDIAQMNWPAKEANDPIEVCELTNSGPTGMLSASVDLTIQFYDLEEASNRSPNLLRQDGAFSAFLYRNGKTYIQGPLIKSLQERVILPSVEASKARKVYFVNQSAHIVRFNFPKSANAIQANNSEKVEINLIRPPIKAHDIFPFFSLPPTIYNWKPAS